MIIMVGSFVGIFIKVRKLKNEMSRSGFHAGAASGMQTAVTKTAAIVCGTYMALCFPAFLVQWLHPQPPCENLPGKKIAKLWANLTI